MYNIYRDGSFLAATTLLSYVDSGLTNGDAYSYRISANNTVGEGALSAVVIATPAGVPDAPSIICFRGDHAVLVSWFSVFPNGDAIISYDIYRNGSFVATTTEHEYEDTGLTNGASPQLSGPGPQYGGRGRSERPLSDGTRRKARRSARERHPGRWPDRS